MSRRLGRQGSINRAGSVRNVAVPGRKTNRLSSRYNTLKSSNVREYPRTFQTYLLSSQEALTEEVITAREFITPQKVLNFNTAARNITGGLTTSKDGSLRISTPGFFNFLGRETCFVKLSNAKILVYHCTEDAFIFEEEDPEPVLEIPFVEIRRICFKKEGLKEFKLVFNSQNEVKGKIRYEAHTLTFAAHDAKDASEWVEAICIGCTNTALFLKSVIEYFDTHIETNREEHKEAFMRQVVDLNTLGRGLVNEATIQSQRDLAEYLSNKTGETASTEAEFWLAKASALEDTIEEYEHRRHGGLESIQDHINLSMRCGNVEDNAQFAPERRRSFLFLPKVTGARKGRKSSNFSKRSGSEASTQSSEPKSSGAKSRKKGVGRQASSRYVFKEV